MKSATVVIETEEGFITAESQEGADFIRAELAKSRKRAERRQSLYPGEGREQMTPLCKSFPSLKDKAKGVEPWDTNTFLIWMLNGCGTSGAIHSARFVLHVFNSHTDWQEVMRRECFSEDDPDDSKSGKLLKKAGRNLVKHIRNQLEEGERDSARDYKRPQRAISDREVEKVVEECLEKFRPFNVSDAISAWDEQHRIAFTTWCENAFWP